MARAQIIQNLAEIPLFAACSKKELGAIARVTTPITLADGHKMTVQDQVSREAFVIVSGKAVVKRNNRKVAEVGPGSMVGEYGLLDRGPRTATVEAQGEVEALVLTPPEFAGILADVPTIATKLLKSMASIIRDLDKKVYG